MLKVTTSHGTYYVIDMENHKAKRVKGEGRNEMYGDSDWFQFNSVNAYDYETQKNIGPIQVGYPMFFTLHRHDRYDWRSSTTVVSIEEM